MIAAQSASRVLFELRNAATVGADAFVAAWHEAECRTCDELRCSHLEARLMLRQLVKPERESLVRMMQAARADAVGADHAPN